MLEKYIDFEDEMKIRFVHLYLREEVVKRLTIGKDKRGNRVELRGQLLKKLVPEKRGIVDKDKVIAKLESMAVKKTYDGESWVEIDGIWIEGDTWSNAFYLK
jgi:hypothetical protein